MGERTPIALLDAAAASRMAIAESMTNLAGRADRRSCPRVKLSANWMAACGERRGRAPVRRRSEGHRPPISARRWASACRSARIRCRCARCWTDGDGAPGKSASPVTSLIVTAFGAVVDDVRGVLTPQLVQPDLDSVLILVDLGQPASQRHRRFGAVAGVRSRPATCHPGPVEDPSNCWCKLASAVMSGALHRSGKLLAYHDRSDGGLFASAVRNGVRRAHCGVALNVDLLTIDPHSADWGDFKIRPEQVAVQRNELTLKALFNEEIGVGAPGARRTSATRCWACCAKQG